MTTKPELSNRIAAAVRIGQEAAGHSKPWFKDGSIGLYRLETGEMILKARVPVGPRFRVLVRSGIIDETSPDERVSHPFVEDLVAALPTIGTTARQPHSKHRHFRASSASRMRSIGVTNSYRTGVTAWVRPENVFRRRYIL